MLLQDKLAAIFLIASINRFIVANLNISNSILVRTTCFSVFVVPLD